MKISEWFSDEIQKTRENGIIGISHPSGQDARDIAKTSRKLSELEVLRDEALDARN